MTDILSTICVLDNGDENPKTLHLLLRKNEIPGGPRNPDFCSFCFWGFQIFVPVFAKTGSGQNARQKNLYDLF